MSNNDKATPVQWAQQLESDQTTTTELLLASRLRKLPKMMMPPALKQELRRSLIEQAALKHSGHPVPKRRLAFLTAVAVLLAVLIVSVFMRPAYLVSASEIMARAAHITNLQSYQGVMSGQAMRTSYAMNSWQQFVWFKAPNQWRVEYYTAIPQGAVSPLIQQAVTRSQPSLSLSEGSLYFGSVLVSDQHDAWSLYAGRTLERMNAEDVTAKLDLWRPLGVADYSGDNLDKTLDALKIDYRQATLVGTETLAGRSAYLVELLPKVVLPDSSQSIAKVRLWIDKETYFQLGAEARSIDDTILWKAVFTSLEINPLIPDDIFHFTPPPELAIYDRRAALITTPAELTQIWGKVAAQVNFAVYAPSYIPAYLVPKTPLANTTDAQQMVVQDYASSTNPVVLTISQIGAAATFPHMAGFMNVSIGTFSGFYQDLGKGTSQLVFVNDKTFTVLAVYSEVTKDELIRIARSLQLVHPQ